MYVYILRSKCRKNTRNVFYKTRAARNTGSKGNIDRSKCALAATDAMRAARNSCSKGNIAGKEISIIAIVRWQQQTRYMCIFFVLNEEKHQ